MEHAREGIAIYTLTSALHDEASVQAATQSFLSSLGIEYTLCGANFDTYGQQGLSLIYVRTGGTECILKPLLPQLLRQSSQPIYLLTSGQSNSLAASMEILSYLRQQGISGEILHGTPQYIHNRILTLARVTEARRRLFGQRLGIIGTPSDWLISSQADAEAVARRLDIELVDIPMSELMEVYEQTPEGEDAELQKHAPNKKVADALPGALRIYHAIRVMVDRYQLSGLTIRCFDLLTAVRNTGCIALARLNAEGIVGTCEGDVPAMLSMAIARAVTGVSGFQANPARINPETGEMLFAHCTIPFDMLRSYELDTHFESGLGVGICGYMPEGDVTLFKVSGDLSRHFVAEGTLLRSQHEAGLCRTQQVIRLNDPSQTRYFLTDPIGNHHIIVPGKQADILTEILR